MSGSIQNFADVNNHLVLLNHDASYAAGSDFTVSPTGHTLTKLVSLSFDFTTDANAADRLVRLKLARGGVDYFLSSAGATQPASKTLRYFFMIAGPLSDIPSPVCYHAPLPASFIFLVNDTLQSDIVNIQAGDQVTNADYVMHLQPYKD